MRLQRESYRVIAATIGMSGWALAVLYWLIIRLTGSLELRFSGIGFVNWVEMWVEPIVLFSTLGLSVWLVVNLHQDVTKQSRK